MTQSPVAADRRALVVEDDEDISELISFTLAKQGFEVRTAHDGPSAVAAVPEFDPDLITLDLGLPGLDGMEVCRRVRTETDAYVVMITARTDEVDRLIGLETGADDFLAKPFSSRELAARVNAMFRRPRRGPEAPAPADPEKPPVMPGEDHEVLRHGALTVDGPGRQVHRDGTELELTRTEFDLLTELMRTPARVWSREALLRSVWGNEWASDTHLVEVHVGNLRRKLSQGTKDLRFIRTVRGVGYRMEAVPAS